MTLLVTGGHSPIAQAVATHLVETGYSVVLTTRDSGGELETLRGLSPRLAVETLSFSSQEKTVEEFLALDANYLFSGLVFGHRYRGVKLGEHVQSEVEIPVRLVQEFAALERPSGNHAAVFFSSPGAQRYIGDQGISYHISKAAIESAVRFLAAELGPQGIRVNAVSPGAYVTKERAANFYRANPDVLAWGHHVTPLRRFARPQKWQMLLSSWSARTRHSLRVKSYQSTGGPLFSTHPD